MNQIKSNIKTEKMVQFNPNVVVHKLCVWTFAYEEARKSEWLKNMSDSFRFKQRIQKTEDLLCNILSKNCNNNEK